VSNRTLLLNFLLPQPLQLHYGGVSHLLVYAVHTQEGHLTFQDDLIALDLQLHYGALLDVEPPPDLGGDHYDPLPVNLHLHEIIFV